MMFLGRLCQAVKGQPLPPLNTSPSLSANGPVERALRMLDTIDSWIDEIPPLNTPQRFGNLAFRTWGQRLGERAEQLLEPLFDSSIRSAIPFVVPYLLTSFGDFTRMDYGTGHEASFGFFLLSLTLVGHFKAGIEQDRVIALQVFYKYLLLTHRLQDTYRLEPAGSHGVWGLDDSCFLPYLFGSAQMLGFNTLPSVMLGLMLPNAPNAEKEAVDNLPPNFYSLSLRRILEVKSGPFHEHSSQLYSIATGVPRWEKVFSGLGKMYDAEVLGKRVVVQHLPLGGLYPWDPTPT